MGLLPLPKVYDDRVKNINKLLKKDFGVPNKCIHYLDISEKYRDPKTKLENTSLYVDGVHPNNDGYKIWAASMEPLLRSLIAVSNDF